MQCRKHYVSEKNKKAKGICLVKLSNDVTRFVTRMVLENSLLSSWNGALHLKGFSVSCLGVKPRVKNISRVKVQKIIPCMYRWY